MMSQSEKISMVQECVSRYEVEDRGDDGIHVKIEIPRRFADLWLVKLSDLRATDEEIAEYGDECDDSLPPDNSR